MMNEKSELGFEYTVEVIKNGEVIDREVIHNLMPTEGLNHVLNVILKGASQVPTWYVGVYEGAYTPVAGDTAATFPGAATEATDYVGTTRVAFQPGTVASGSVDNTANRAEFTFNSTRTIYGGFIASASAKGSTSGVLLSAVRFGSPKAVDSTSILRVTAGFTMASI